MSNTNDSGAGSLRQAIIDANAAVGTDTIAFDIPGSGVQTIRPLSVLPYFTDPVILDGTTQPGYTTSPIIELEGSLAGAGVYGLLVHTGGAGSLIRGLVVNRFASTGIVLIGGGNVIEGNYLGTDASGTIDRGNGGNGLELSSSGNTIGGIGAGKRNVVSGNDSNGIWLYSTNANNNVIEGNIIGLNAAL